MESRIGKPGDRSTRARSRRLALALVLGLMVTLALAVTADAYVARKTETTLADFDTGTFRFTGLLDLPDRVPPVDSVQLLPIGLTGDWQISSSSLPVALANLAAASLRDIVFVVGGTDDQQDPRNLVYSARASLNGDVTPWQGQSPLPGPRGSPAAAIFPRPDAGTSILYVVGGADDSGNGTDTIFRAPFDNDTGQVGEWSTDTKHLPLPVLGASAVIHDGALYVIGGLATGTGQALSRVDWAPIASDGSLGDFVETYSLPKASYYALPIVYDGVTTDTLYLIGGRNDITSTFQVFFADFVAGGGLDEWHVSQGSLPHHLYGHSGTYYNGEIIVTGGVVNSMDPSTGISSTVRVALVDPDNPGFRLYNWCENTPDPNCTIGAWQTGALLPAERDLHGTLASHGYFYVIGGEDPEAVPRTEVFYGTINGEGALYAPEGQYLSSELDLGVPASFLRLSWGATIGHPGQMGLSLQVRSRQAGGAWGAWSAPVASISGTNVITPTPPAEDVRFVQYRASFATDLTSTSPLLDWVQVYYEVDDPDLRVTKHTGSVISVSVGSQLEYTILYTNTGEWVAENAVLTETLPDYTTYVGGGAWHQVGASNVYTHALGNVGPDAEDSLSLVVLSDADTPSTIRFLTNTVALDYPPMLDAFGVWVTDPTPGNNLSRWVNPLNFLRLEIAKSAQPPSGSLVQPGQTLSYTLAYTNAGSELIEQLRLTDTLPAEVTFVAGSLQPPTCAYAAGPRQIRCDLGTLAPDVSGSVTFRASVKADVPAGTTITNHFLAGAAGAGVRMSNPTLHHVPLTGMGLSKSADPPSGSLVNPGASIEYTLVVSNGGDSSLTGVVVTDGLPSQVSYVPGSIWPAYGDDADPALLVWSLPSPLAPGAQVELGFSVAVAASPPPDPVIKNTALARCAQIELPSAASTEHAIRDPDGPDLTLQQLAASSDAPLVGEPFVVTGTIANIGATDVIASFWAEVYVLPTAEPDPSTPGDHEGAVCSRSLSSMASGTGQDLVFDCSEIVLPAAGVFKLCAQVDIALAGDSPSWGRIVEADEANNVLCVPIGPKSVYLPLISRGGSP